MLKRVKYKDYCKLINFTLLILFSDLVPDLVLLQCQYHPLWSHPPKQKEIEGYEQGAVDYV